MSSTNILSALTDKRIGMRILEAERRVLYAAPGIQPMSSKALVNLAQQFPDILLSVNVDFDEHIVRMGYGTVEAVESLKNNGVTVKHSPGLRCGILIVDNKGWVFTPTALYLEPEPQSDETPNAIALSVAQIQEIAIRLSPEEREKAVKAAPTPEAAEAIASTQTELGMEPLHEQHFKNVEQAIKTAPPVKFDVVRQVRVFEPYLQYVEVSLTGAALQRKRVRIPKALLTMGSSKDLEGKLKTTYDLIEKGDSLSSKSIEDELNEIRKNFTPSLSKDHGRVLLKNAKPKFEKRIAELQNKLKAHQARVEAELQSEIDTSKRQVVEYYLPLAKANPPDRLVGGCLTSEISDSDIKTWIYSLLDPVFPSAESLIRKMTLDVRYKDVTFETLNREDFFESIQIAFPMIDWVKTYDEFRAAGETAETEENIYNYE